MNNCKIIIAGGSGFIGQHIAKYFAVNNKVIILTRQLHEASNIYGNEILQHANNDNISFVKWNMNAESEWQHVFEDSDLL